jgi:hypothetical protein
MTGDRPVSPQQAAQLLADLVFVQGRDPDLFDNLWPQLVCPAVFCVARVLPVLQTDSAHPYRFHYDFATCWPADGLRN